MPIFVAPTAGLLSTRTGTRPLVVAGLACQAIALAWLSFVTSPTVDYAVLVPAFVLAGIGMGLFFAPIANVVLSAVRPEEEGKASGANNAIREIGGVFGVAVLASVFSANGSYLSGEAFVSGLVPALQVGAVAVGIGAIAALAIGSRARGTERETVSEGAVSGLDAAAA
jgi:MFS family permease